MIHGGDGDDYIKAGLAAGFGTTGTEHRGFENLADDNADAAYHYLYGDAGND